MKAFKNNFEQTLELIKSKNTKEIYYSLRGVAQTDSYGDKLEFSEGSENGQILLDLIVENSNDFTRDIAKKSIEMKFNLSEKQAWCLAYQICNNQEVYVSAINDLKK